MSVGSGAPSEVKWRRGARVWCRLLKAQLGGSDGLTRVLSHPDHGAHRRILRCGPRKLDYRHGAILDSEKPARTRLVHRSCASLARAGRKELIPARHLLWTTSGSDADHGSALSRVAALSKGSPGARRPSSRSSGGVSIGDRATAPRSPSTGSAQFRDRSSLADCRHNPSISGSRLASA
jgi:hypothetical protein